MSFADELRNAPRDVQPTKSPREMDLEKWPDIKQLVDRIKIRCSSMQRQGIHQYQGMLFSLWVQESDNDGGYFNAHGDGYDFLPTIVGKQKLLEYANAIANEYRGFANYYPYKREGVITAMDAVYRMNRENSACSNSGSGPIFYQCKETAVELRDQLRDEMEKLGFDRNSVAAIEVPDFQIKVQVKARRELITHDPIYRRKVSEPEFTGKTFFSVIIRLSW